MLLIKPEQLPELMQDMFLLLELLELLLI